MMTRPGVTRLSDIREKTTHQERVNVEMFKAMEQLGRKLEHVEDERDRLTRRMALLESSATVDEKTGKLYLPAVISAESVPPSPAQPGWVAAASLLSSMIALGTLAIVLFREPPPVLTKEQMVALNTLMSAELTRIDQTKWESSEAAAAIPPEQDLLIEPPVEQAATAGLPAPEITEAIPVESLPVVPPAPPAESVAAPVSEESTALEDVIIPGEDKIESVTAKQDIAPVITPSPALVAEEEPVVLRAVKTTPAVRKVEKKTPPPVVVKEEKPAARMPAAEEESQASRGDIPRDVHLPSSLTQLEQHAFEGAAEAQHDLATIYASGKAVPQDYKRAVYWFARAADGGIANAYYNLGVMFQQGLGVKKDVNKALGWYERAAKIDHPEALYNLGIAYVQGIGTSVDVERGVGYFKAAANAGVAQAAFNLGILYESSFVGAADAEKALEWYQVAARQGHVEATEAAARLKSSLPPAESKAPAAAQGGDDSLSLADMVEPATGKEFYEDKTLAAAADDRAQNISFKNDTLMKIQEILIGHGYLPGRPTGLMTPQTEDAIRAWQSRKGLAVDGAATPALLSAMQAAEDDTALQ